MPEYNIIDISLPTSLNDSPNPIPCYLFATVISAPGPAIVTTSSARIRITDIPLD
jgi:hypothetical protein